LFPPQFKNTFLFCIAWFVLLGAIDKNLLSDKQTIKQGRLDFKAKDVAKYEQAVADNKNCCDEISYGGAGAPRIMHCAKRHDYFCTQPCGSSLIDFLYIRLKG